MNIRYCKHCESVWEGLPAGMDECPDCQEELTNLPEDLETDLEIYEKENK